MISNITGTTRPLSVEEDAVIMIMMTTPSVGTSMYLSDNTMTIKAGDDGIHASGDLITIVVLTRLKIN